MEITIRSSYACMCNPISDRCNWHSIWVQLSRELMFKRPETRGRHTVLYVLKHVPTILHLLSIPCNNHPQSGNYKYGVSQIIRHTLCVYDTLHYIRHSNILTMSNIFSRYKCSVIYTVPGRWAAPSQALLQFYYKYVYHYCGGNVFSGKGEEVLLIRNINQDDSLVEASLCSHPIYQYCVGVVVV